MTKDSAPTPASPPHDFTEIGKAAYSAYGKEVRWRNYQGDPMPDWGTLPDQTKRAWGAAAKAAVEQFVMSALSDEHPTSRVMKF